MAGLLATGDNWKPYCRALEAYLQQVAAHPTLNKNRDLETFLTSTEVSSAVKTMTNTALWSCYFGAFPLVERNTIVHSNKKKE